MWNIIKYCAKKPHTIMTLLLVIDFGISVATLRRQLDKILKIKKKQNLRMLLSIRLCLFSKPFMIMCWFCLCLFPFDPLFSSYPWAGLETLTPLRVYTHYLCLYILPLTLCPQGYINTACVYLCSLKRETWD